MQIYVVCRVAEIENKTGDIGCRLSRQHEMYLPDKGKLGMRREEWLQHMDSKIEDNRTVRTNKNPAGET